MLSDISSDILSGILFDISSEILRGQGPAGITLIQRLLFGPGGDHCDHKVRRGPLILGLLFGSGGGHCDLALAVDMRSDRALAVRFRWGSLRSGACSRLRFGFGREHCDLVLAVEVGGTTLILGLLFRSG